MIRVDQGVRDGRAQAWMVGPRPGVVAVRRRTAASQDRQVDGAPAGRGLRHDLQGRRHPPAAAERSPRTLSLAEREEISRGLAAEVLCRAIARGLGRSASTVTREVAAGGGRQAYRAVRADQAAQGRRLRPKTCKLAARPELALVVSDKLVRRWSPEQIAGWLRRMHPDEPERRVSHETIYRSLFVQAKGALRHELTGYLCTRRVMRRPPGASPLHGKTMGRLHDMVSIRQRPAEVADAPYPATGKAT